MGAGCCHHSGHHETYPNNYGGGYYNTYPYNCRPSRLTCQRQTSKHIQAFWQCKQCRSSCSSHPYRTQSRCRLITCADSPVISFNIQKIAGSFQLSVMHVYYSVLNLRSTLFIIISIERHHYDVLMIHLSRSVLVIH